MTKNGIILVVLLAILGAIYAAFFTDWFRKQSILIIPMANRPTGQRVQQNDPTVAQANPVMFMFRGNYRFTSIKVVSAEDLATNQYPTVLWHLISDSNSVPTKSFSYGERILGMKPAVPRSRPETLQPGVKYVLLLEAGKIKGQTNFVTRELVKLK